MSFFIVRFFPLYFVSIYGIYKNPIPFIFAVRRPCHAHCLHPAGSSWLNRRSLRRAAAETREVDPLERSVILKINLMGVDLCPNTACIFALQWILWDIRVFFSTINSPVIIYFAFAFCLVALTSVQHIIKTWNNLNNKYDIIVCVLYCEV